jgi:hypothetical protein
MTRGLKSIVLATGCLMAGWFAHGLALDHSCQYTRDYVAIPAGFYASPRVTWESVGDEVLGEIQRCWAAHPFEGPQHSLQFEEVRKAPGGGFYIVSVPYGITDIQLVFHVRANSSVSEAFVASTQ